MFLDMTCPYCYEDSKYYSEDLGEGDGGIFECTSCNKEFSSRLSYMPVMISKILTGVDPSSDIRALQYSLELEVLSLRNLMLKTSKHYGEDWSYDYFLSNLREKLEIGYNAFMSLEGEAINFRDDFNPENFDKWDNYSS